MLRQLSIRNLVLIDRLSLTFQPGFTVLTGETGAGKSILLDALGLVLGGRADSRLVRHGSERADIEAEFDITFLPEVQQWLTEEELIDEEAPHTLTLRRTVRADGGSRAWINGLRAPVARLKALASRLIDIHSQHAQQHLLDPNHQRDLLDAFGQLQTLRQQTADAWHRWQQAQAAWEAAQAQQADRERRIFELQQQLEALAPLAPSAETYHQLSQRQSQLAHAQTLEELSATALDALHDAETSATARLTATIDALERILEIDPALQHTLTQLNEQLVILTEAAEDIRRYRRHLTLDPHELAEVEQQLAEYHRLARRFMTEPEALETLHARCQAEWDQLSNFDEHLAELSARCEAAEQAYRTVAERLRQHRLTAAETLAREVETLIQPLGMPHARFHIEVAPTAPGRWGMDVIRFLFTANPGQPLQPLNQCASGGELSRVSLAIEMALAEVAGIPILVFDEADSGVGGRVAEQIGRLMRRLGAHRQVLAVTHQPQVAACAHQHLTVRKEQTPDTTRTIVQPLDEAARIEELARMLGGETITDTTRQHAHELLTLAQS